MAGQCIVWAKPRDGYWTKMPYAPRAYYQCLQLVARYESLWGHTHQYKITAALDVCMPVG